MIANSEARGTLPRIVGRLTMAVGLAATAGIILTATAAPVRLVGVTREGDTVLIEATEPVAYSVSRPDALTLVVDMRNVSVSDARADIATEGAITGVRLEQASAVDGRALARVHVTLAKPSEYTVRSARNTIRVELKGAAPASPRAAVTPKPRRPRHRHAARDSPRRHPARRRRPVQPQTAAPVKSIEPGPRAAPAHDRGDDHRADQVQQDAGRHDRHARRQRASRAGRRHRKQGSSAPARARFSERDVEGADADGDRQPARHARARRAQQPPAARHPRRDGNRQHDELSRGAERRQRTRPRGRLRAGTAGQHGHDDAGRAPGGAGRTRAADQPAAGDGQRRRDHQAGAGRRARRSDARAQDRRARARAARRAAGRERERAASTPARPSATAAVAPGRADARAGAATTAPTAAAAWRPRPCRRPRSLHRRQAPPLQARAQSAPAAQPPPTPPAPQGTGPRRRSAAAVHRRSHQPRSRRRRSARRAPHVRRASAG